MHKTIFYKLFHSLIYMRLTFHLDCKKLIFDRISWNTHPNRMGLVSLWSRSKIFVGKQNSWIWFQSSHFSDTRSNFHSNSSSLDLQSSNAQMVIEGLKMGVYIVILGEGKLKGHQINGSLPLGNIIGHLTLPQLIPHFGNLHWRMDNFGLPYGIELRFGT